MDFCGIHFFLWQTGSMLSLVRNPYRDLEKSLGYRFSRRRHLEEALTHPSYRAEHAEIKNDNQRLEYLGDAALSLVCGAHLFHDCPDVAEGPLTQMRSAVTSQKALAELARAIGIGPFLKLGKGEIRAGGHERDSTLEDAMEAILGAVYLDGGLKGVEKIFKKWIAPRLRAEDDTLIEEKNPKGALQQVCQERWHVSPRYDHLESHGPEHSKRFLVRVLLEGRELARGEGASKKLAEVAAAEAALESLVSPGRRRRRGGRGRGHSRSGGHQE